MFEQGWDRGDDGGAQFFQGKERNTTGEFFSEAVATFGPVSYTHLTLPTICSV